MAGRTRTQPTSLQDKAIWFLIGFIAGAIVVALMFGVAFVMGSGGNDSSPTQVVTVVVTATATFTPTQTATVTPTVMVMPTLTQTITATATLDRTATRGAFCATQSAQFPGTPCP